MRLWSLRRRRTRRTIVLAVATGAAGIVVTSVMARANDLADDYGPRQVIAIAANDLETGTEIADGDLRWVERPVELIGGTAADHPVGRVVVEPVLRGEAIVDERLAVAGAHGASALTPDGSRALAVPTPTGRPPLAVGDRVEVVATTLDGSTARRVARDAVVVAMEDEAVTVAVAGDELAAVARAVLDGTAVLALAAPR
jgi:Flp pilus assembly protein CpaB